MLVLFVYWLAHPSFGPGRVFFHGDFALMAASGLAARAARAAMLAGALLIVLTLARGRVFCGWACPLGSAIDGVDAVVRRPRRWDGAAGTKYLILFAGMGLAAAGVGLLWLFAPMSWAARVLSVIPPAPAEVVAGILLLFVLVGLSAAAGPRAFCRILCPLGAGMGLVTRLSPYSRKSGGTCVQCGACRQSCPTGAASGTGLFTGEECIQCGTCERVCPESAVETGMERTPASHSPARRAWFAAAGAGVGAGMLASLLRSGEAGAVRPPGGQDETRLVNLCVRCGACERICPTGGIYITRGRAGLFGLESPALSGRNGGCAYDCNLCGLNCPTGALLALPLAEKRRMRLGLARVDSSICIPYARKTVCMVCYASCPYDAIVLEDTGEKLPWGDPLLRPRVDDDKCTGCGLCETACPVSGGAAVRIRPVSSAGPMPAT